ncbi:versican core protein [Danaus plexippus]|uniref:versican core protein n=1 Tax=Danaus plexippus TaxID=13037 RepID=UPI002AB22B2B|nr:versican core protein [Danaus plexippus]
MLKFLFSVFLFCICFDSYVLSKQYRNDYTYNKKTDSFYKLHTETLTFRKAKTVCEYEGAGILVLTSEYDVIQVHEMFKQYPDLDNYAWVAGDGKQHDSAELKPIIDLENLYVVEAQENIKDDECDVIQRDGKVDGCNCYRQLPFVCKVEARNAFYDPHCKVFGKDYQYFETVGSCYKVPRISYSWNQAYADCQSQGAHLAVLNSEAEHSVIRHQILNKIENSLATVYHPKTEWFFIAGIRAQKATDGSALVFKTIFNQTLEEAGYNEWSPNEPNNSLGNEYCGTIFKNDGKYNDVDCSDYYAFICEKEIDNV